MTKASEFNILTNKTTERNLTAQELAEGKKCADEMAVIETERQAIAEAAATAKAELLTRLGITADEARLLL